MRCLNYLNYTIDNILCLFKSYLKNNNNNNYNYLIKQVNTSGTINNNNNQENNNNNNNQDDDKHFKAWFVGFTTGDGHFGIRVDNQHYFTVLLKQSDIITLENIKSNLDLSNNIYHDVNNKRVILIIQSRVVIKDKLLPIFKEYPLLSNKFYSFEQWNKSLELVINNNDFSLTKELHKSNTLNVGLVLSDSKIPFDKINKSIVLGIIEAEGSFIINMIENNNWRLEINISQNETSKIMLEHISKFINLWLFNELTPQSIKNYLNNTKIHNILTPNSSEQLNLKGYTNRVSLLRVTQIDLLYYVIVPTLNNIKWYSSKYIDFIIFKMVLNILIRGLNHTSRGNNLIYELYKKSNLNLTSIDKLPWEEYFEVLNLNNVYDINLPYLINSKNYVLSKKLNKNILSGVYIYDLEGNFIKLVGGQDNTAKYFNVSKHNIVKHLNSGKVFLNKYILKKPK